jgi:inhibitor of the pro-sigma K processing machinery
MSPPQQILFVMGGLVLAVVMLRLYRKPFKWALRMAVNSVIGLLCLIAYDFVSSGIAGAPGVGVSLQNALVVGLLGAPGFAMLAAFPWVLG